MRSKSLLWMAGLAVAAGTVIAGAACGGDDAEVTPSPASSTAAARIGALEITQPSARATLDRGSVYLTVKNDSDTADALVAAAADVAGKAELHKTTTEGATTKMEPVPQIDVPANGEAVLKMGSYHIMMMDLKNQLRVGDTFNLTLTFKSAGSVTLPVSVASYVESSPMSSPGMDGMGGTPSPAMSGGTAPMQ